MTEQENKELLLKDLCERLPYGVKIHANDTNVDNEKVGVLSMVDNDAVIAFTCDDANTYNYVTIHEVKPYLFPLSSMTEEQKSQYNFYLTRIVFAYDASLLIDWLNKNHFDYRWLIKKSLALDATNLNVY